MLSAAGGFTLGGQPEQKRGHHDQPQLLGMIERIWRCQDDHGVAGSADTQLPHRRNGQRVCLQHSSLVAQTKIKSGERKRKDDDGTEDDEPF